MKIKTKNPFSLYVSVEKKDKGDGGLMRKIINDTKLSSLINLVYFDG